MRINHNIHSINTYRQLNLTQSSVSKSLEKLSSELCINRAADDVTGLAISKKMQAQIRGLNQAERNILNGISLKQTAEEGLASIQDMVQRMREFAIQISNGTLTVEDRQSIQKGIEQLKKGVNEIANNTDFNRIRPLRQEVTTPFPPSSNTTMVDIVFLVDYSSSMGYTYDSSTRLGAVMDDISGFIDGLREESLDTNIAIISISTNHPHYRSFSQNVNTVKENLKGLSDWDSGTRPYQTIENSSPDDKIRQKLTYRPGSEKIFVLFTNVYNECNSGTEESAGALLEGSNNLPGFDDDDIQTYVLSFVSTADNTFDTMTDITCRKLCDLPEIRPLKILKTN